MLGQQMGAHMVKGAFRILNETSKESKRGISDDVCGIGVSPNKEVDGGAILEIWTEDGKIKKTEYGLPREMAQDIIDTSNRNKISYTNHNSQMRRKMKAEWALLKDTSKSDAVRMEYETGLTKIYQDTVTVLPDKEEGRVVFIVRTAEEEHMYFLTLTTIGEIETIIKK